METKLQPPKPIPTTRAWYKEFKELIEEKLRELDQKTGIHRVRWYTEGLDLPFRLWWWQQFDAGFKTDWELYECVYWMLWGLEFKS